ncbi:isoquinoline 1-oxidoreductase subunit alpha [Geobacter sp. OR-1]|uniref:(2Fe-2S)-binding protein n=1 Tax=Geobacter sp. OR-1 TaxID=1266765 RepID=UPI000541C144|nr:(2Fe-2S)-binding protein [Geobacter sp. OR-1]GAM09894.1 isoquinoline 1-oxidoreductase subunit alpha [Geobacter sp. OR-1]
MISLTVNGKKYQVDAAPDSKLLWVLREQLGLTGAKFGCGIGMCGACTVLVDGKARRSCITPVSAVKGKKVVTIEGLPENHPLKVAWIAEQVPQCGYCQPGQMMQAAGLLNEHPKPTESEIDSAMSGCLCRCGTYQRVKSAINRAAGKGKKP